MPTQNVGKFFDFRARVTAPTWTIDPDNGLGASVVPGASRRRSSGMEQVVELGTSSLDVLQAGGSLPQFFSVELNEDRLKGASKVQVYFDGITSDGVILMNDYEEAGSARNVGVQLLDSEGKVVLLGHEGRAEYPVAPGFRLSFAARLVSANGPVEAGEFSSFSECVILYA
ncbi:major type 1 subunit fimbrin (pilin) [Pseudomonas sp. LAMO17WK12:I10]|uniref:fimbrial protein n=1 Tax=unclassified Pseudomonas TaxID=196821 RepID=UPI000BD4D3C7|nr:MULTISPECIES: fimbrial protein [unclassified Pseudomonas]PXX59552.1 major type 1 subunit fimbrin (pilin) [Pseudomonas sp. LAMO17WK12:I9]SNY46841.1 major type 1 subunit fimbrin (pilin) [Pseudomonas sp. LAMO17WK12:I10]